jgi:NADPH:quinone reductase
MQLWNWHGLDVVNAHERDPRIYIEGMRAAAAAVAERRLDPSFLYTHRFSVEDLPAAFAALEQRPAGFLKAWIQPQMR